jgi:hypothetical protein
MLTKHSQTCDIEERIRHEQKEIEENKEFEEFVKATLKPGPGEVITRLPPIFYEGR